MEKVYLGVGLYECVGFWVWDGEWVWEDGVIGKLI